MNPMIEYQDFSLKIEPKRGDVYPVIVLRSPAGEGRSSFQLPFEPDEVGNILLDLSQAVRSGGRSPVRDTSPGATRTPPQRIGDQLFSALFSGPVRSLFDRSLGMIHGRQRGLRIKIHIDPEHPSLAQLASLPWEFLYRKETRDFLNLSSLTPVVRYLDVQRPYTPLTLEPPLRILVVVSDLADYARLDLERERALIEATWGRQEGVEVEFMEQATILALQDRLTGRPYHVLHYMGHGDFDRHTGRGVLLMEDENGLEDRVDGATLGVLLHDIHTMRLVFLNACETAKLTREKGLDPFAGVAAAMVMAGIPAVVAMQFPITDRAAITFAQRFYSLLARGYPVDAAVAGGRQATRLAAPETMEWGTPVLFMRAPEGVIFHVTDSQRVKLSSIPEPPQVDAELERRLEQLYTDGLSAFWLEKWEMACRSFQAIVEARPDYQDAAAKLETCQQQWQWATLYNRALAAQDAGEWQETLVTLEQLMSEAPNYKDANVLLETAKQQAQLADLYAQARQLHQAEQWQAVVNVFAQIASIDPDYADPEELLPTAEREAGEAKRQAELDHIYSRALREMDAGQWEKARQRLARALDMAPGYREAAKLLNRVMAEFADAEAKRQRREHLETLYQQALGLADARQWRQAQAKMDEIQALDPQYPDPEGVIARAQDQVAKEEAEAERQKQLAALYAEAVRLLRAGGHQEALEKWREVQALDSQYPDRQKVEATARKKLAPRPRPPRPKRGLSRWAVAAVGGFTVVAIVAAVVLLSREYESAPQVTPTIRERIAFTSDRDGNDEIYVMNADGSGLVNLTNHDANDRKPSWSPDGTHIAFASDRNGAYGIYVMEADGGGVTRLTSNLADDDHPAWSPDGKHIAFTSDHDGNWEIHVMNADGSGQTNLTNYDENDQNPSWSPDGRYIAFNPLRDGDNEIYVMNADGSGLVNLTNNPAHDWGPVWSPDGRHIVFTSDRDGPWGIYVMNADGSGVSRLTDNSTGSWLPSWSPDGRRIAFTSNRDGNHEVYVMNADGSGLVNLTNNPALDCCPSWGP
jgi:Tol biopolymer transport system component/outer membrane protein assembly factor BamD (BamD/ComL family)